MKHILVSMALAICASAALPAAAQTKGSSVTAVLQSDPTGLVLAFPSNGPAQLVSSKIYEGLVTYSFELKPQPSLARSWDITPDGLTYTFKLQPNVKWNDGKDFSSADVVFSLAKMLPETSVSARQALQEVQSIEAPDAETVVIKLKKPVPYLMMTLPSVQMPMMPKHIYEGTDYAKNPANATPVGTGPFKLDQWKRGSFLRLVKNPNYWNKGRPMVDAITFRIIPDAASRAIALETGEIQIASSIDLSSVDIKAFQANKDFGVSNQGWEYLSQMAMLELNWRRPFLSDVRFRRALYHGMDRNFVLNGIWHGNGRIATGPINSKIPFFAKDLPRYDFNPAKAKSILDEMGLKADGSGHRHDAKGERVKISLLILPGDERYTQLAQYLREAWQGIGVEVNLQKTDTAGWESRLKNWDFDIAMNNLSQFGDPGFGIRRYYDSANIRKGTIFTNTTGYSNADVDKWFAEANVETNIAKRGELYARIQKKLVEDVAMIWMLEQEPLTIYHKSIHQIVSSAFGPRGSWDQMYVKK